MSFVLKLAKVVESFTIANLLMSAFKPCTGWLNSSDSRGLFTHLRRLFASVRLSLMPWMYLRLMFSCHLAIPG